MSSIVGAITGGGGSGMDFKAKSADLLNPATVAQANEQYGNINTGIQNQAGFLQALQAQNGIQNQSNVFNQMQGVANGTGPNPAQAQLANATGANIQNQAALMAGQRGSGANAGLMARQAGMQGGALQQQAAGQGAALQAQQSLGALNQLGGMAGQQVAQQGQATGALTQAGQNAYGQVTGNINNQNNAAVGNASQQNSANASIANNVASQQGNFLGNAMGAIGGAAMKLAPLALTAFSGGAAAPALMAGGAMDAGALGSGMMMAAEGGEVKQGPQSHAGMYLHGKLPMAHGGKVPAMVSPGEKYIPPSKVNDLKKGKNPMEVGKTIPGKPKVAGAKNDYANDTVPATLEEGGIVIPRSVTQGKNPEKKAAEFVAAILKKQSLKK